MIILVQAFGVFFGYDERRDDPEVLRAAIVAPEDALGVDRPFFVLHLRLVNGEHHSVPMELRFNRPRDQLNSHLNVVEE